MVNGVPIYYSCTFALIYPLCSNNSTILQEYYNPCSQGECSNLLITSGLFASKMCNIFSQDARTSQVIVTYC